MDLIQDSEALQRVCDVWLQHPQPTFIAVDTEFLRETTYWPRLCLIQVAGLGVHALIDPLASSAGKTLDLQPLYTVLRSEKILKVFHAARQDMEALSQLMGDAGTFPIFDTQVAAMALGLGDAVSYQTLVKTILVQEIDKEARRTDWSARPLTAQQMDYALQDVLGLEKIYPVLKKDLEQKGRMPWVQDEVQHLSSPDTYAVRPERVIANMRGVPIHTLNSRRYAVLYALCQWREQQAMAQNIPRRHFLPDDALFEVARSSPQDGLALGKLKKFSSHAGSNVDREEILSIVRGEHVLCVHARSRTLPGDRVAGPDLQHMVELLRILLQVCCREHEVSPAFVASTGDLAHIASCASPSCRAVQGWRWDIFGKRALDLKAGRLALTFQDGAIRFLPSDVF